MQNQSPNNQYKSNQSVDGAKIHRKRMPQDLLKRLESLFLGLHINKDQTIGGVHPQPAIESNSRKQNRSPAVPTAAPTATADTSNIPLKNAVPSAKYIPKRILNRPPPIRIPAVRVHNARMQEIEIMKNYAPLQHHKCNETSSLI
jgi:hypothetical protein